MRQLLAATFKTGGGTIVTLLSSILSAKIMAVIVGPAGVGLYSNLAQILQTATAAATFGGPTALVQGLASREGEAQARFLRLAIRACLAMLGLSAMALILAAPWLAPALTGRGDAPAIALVATLAIPLAAAVGLTFAQGVLTGHGAVGRMAVLSIAGSILAVAIVYPAALIAAAGYPWAFVALLSLPNIGAAVLGYRLGRREGWFRPLEERTWEPWNFEAARGFWGLASATLLVALVTSGALLILRALFVKHGGLASAGHFNVAWSLSATYVSVALGSFMTYYLPTLSRAETTAEREKLVWQVWRLSIMLVAPIIVAIVVTKPLLVRLLYSAEFLPALDLLRWMLIGDYVKVAAWVWAMPLLSFARAGAHFWSETLRNAIFLVLSAVLLADRGIEGVGIAFTASYVCYAVFAAAYARFSFGLRIAAGPTICWLLGLAVVLGASVHTWTAPDVQWPSAIGWVAAAVAVSFLVTTKGERSAVAKLLRRKR